MRISQPCNRPLYADFFRKIFITDVAAAPRAIGNFCLLFLAIALITSCGFRLQSVDRLPYKSVYVDGPHTPLAEDLRRYIVSYGRSQLANTPAEADVIVILKDEVSSRNIGSSASVATIAGIGGSGYVVSYNLSLGINFRLTTPKGEELIPARNINQTVTMGNDETKILSIYRQSDEVFRDLRISIVQVIVHQMVVEHQIRFPPPPLEKDQLSKKQEPLTIIPPSF